LGYFGQPAAGGEPQVASPLRSVVTAMTISQNLNTGDPIMPQTRFEWIDNAQFAGAIALAFFAGHVLARILRALLKRRSGKWMD
jgi:hypothetical protein